MFFFSNMVLDILSKHGKLGVIALLARRHALQFVDERMGNVMLFLRFVHNLLLIDLSAHCRIDECFFHLGMHIQFE